MKWAKPKDLLIAYKFSTASEWRRHMAWLEDRGYPHMAQLKNEVERAHRPSGRQALALSGSGSVSPIEGASGANEHAEEVSTLGDDLLAGGA